MNKDFPQITINSKDLSNILKNDDLHEFIKFINKIPDPKQVFKMKISNHNKKNMENLTWLSCILIYNIGNISKYLITKYSPKFIDFLSALNCILKDETYIKFFIDMFFYQNLDNNEIQNLILIISKKKMWYILDYLILSGYKPKNIEEFFKNIPGENLEFYINYLDYEPNEDNFINFLKKDTSPELIRNYQKFYYIFNKNEFRPKIYELIKIKNIDFLKFIEQQGFQFDSKCMDIACENFRFDLIHFLIKRKFKISKKNLEVLFFENEEKLKDKKNKRGSKFFGHSRSRSIYFHQRNKKKNIYKIIYDANLIQQILNYENEIIKIIKYFINENGINNFIKLLLNRLFVKLLLNSNFELVNYFINELKLNLDINTNKNLMDRIVINCIQKDNLDLLKKLFEYNILQKIHICFKKKLIDMAFNYDSNKILKYFSQELKMVFSDKIYYILKNKFKKNKNNIMTNIKTLEEFGYPMDINILNICCTSGNLESVKYLLDINIKPNNNIFEETIINGNYSIANFLIENNCPFRKHNLLDRIIKKSLNDCSYRIFSLRKKKISIKCINYVIKIGGTGSSQCLDILFKHNHFDTIIYVCNKLNIKPQPDKMIENMCKKNLSFENENNEFYKFLKFIDEKLKMNIFEGIEEFRLNKIILNLIKENCFEELKYISDKTNFVFNNFYLITFFNPKHFFSRSSKKIEEKQLNMLKFLENKNLQVTREMFINSCKKLNFIILKYIYDKYKFDFSLKDFHNLIVQRFFWKDRLKIIINELNIKITPYTILLILKHSYCNNDFIYYLIGLVGYITIEIKNFFINQNRVPIGSKRFQKKLDNDFEIKIYEPSQEELVDEEINNVRFVENLNKSSGNYIDHVLNDLEN
ncbi:Hypothetical protein KVN_LOCUS511 [uncultured virus]|nr:Hypothetical protein KVN_LOCUS511 [uncultured virus]